MRPFIISGGALSVYSTISNRFVVSPGQVRRLSPAGLFFQPSTILSVEASPQKQKSLADRIVQASFIVGIAHICLKFAGLIQVKFATHYLDSSLYEPIMVVAFTGVINSLFLIGEEVIGPTFLTLFMQERENQGEEAAWDYTNVVLTFQTLLLIIVTALIVCCPDFFIRLFTKWTEYDHPERYRLLRLSLQVLAPSLCFLSLGSTTYKLLNGYKKFFLAAFGDTSTKICIVLGLVLGMQIFGFDYRAIFVGILTGSVAKLLTHLLALREKLHYLRLSFNWRNPAFRNMLVLMLPLLAGIIFAKVRDNFNNIYILTNLQQEGLLMANDLGRKFFASVQWLVPFALQIALFPFLCELVSQKEREKLGQVLGNSCRMLLAIFVPAAACLAILAMPISIGIFLGGKTGLGIAAWAGISTACYILVLPAAAVECVLMQGFFANQQTVAVTVIGMLSSLVSIIVSYVLIVHFPVGPVASLMVVALGFVFSRCLKSLALAWYLQRNTPMFHSWQMISFSGRIILLTGLAAALTWAGSAVMNTLLPDGIATALAAVQAGNTPVPAVSRWRILLRLLVAGGAGGLGMLIGAWLFRVQEAKQMFLYAWQKIARSRTAAAKREAK